MRESHILWNIFWRWEWPGPPSTGPVHLWRGTTPPRGSQEAEDQLWRWRRERRPGSLRPHVTWRVSPRWNLLRKWMSTGLMSAGSWGRLAWRRTRESGVLSLAQSWNRGKRQHAEGSFAVSARPVLLHWARHGWRVVFSIPGRWDVWKLLLLHPGHGEHATKCEIQAQEEVPQEVCWCG